MTSIPTSGRASNTRAGCTRSRRATSAGCYKDVVQSQPGGLSVRLGLYGWHRADGRVIQSPYWLHALAWADYSQGARLVRRLAAAPLAA